MARAQTSAFNISLRVRAFNETWTPQKTWTLDCVIVPRSHNHNINVVTFVFKKMHFVITEHYLTKIEIEIEISIPNCWLKLTAGKEKEWHIIRQCGKPYIFDPLLLTALLQLFKVCRYLFLHRHFNQFEVWTLSGPLQHLDSWFCCRFTAVLGLIVAVAWPN